MKKYMIIFSPITAVVKKIGVLKNIILVNILLFFLLPLDIFSKTVEYKYNNLGFIQEVQSISGPVFYYIYDLMGNRKIITVSPLDSDGDGLGNGEEANYYGTNPYLFDTDADGLDDGAEVSYWGANWSSDIDNDGLINLLDSDSDGDGYDDGVELANGTDPGDYNDPPQMELSPGTLLPVFLLLLPPDEAADILYFATYYYF